MKSSNHTAFLFGGWVFLILWAGIQWGQIDTLKTQVSKLEKAMESK